jgi:putative transposase
MVHHSDRGVHYACSDYRALLKSHDITPSMSRKGDCWDNAVAESFFSSFGFELEFDANWRDVHDVERDTAEYIDGFYNPRRRHSHNRYLSPIDFEHQFMQQENASGSVSTEPGQAQSAVGHESAATATAAVPAWVTKAPRRGSVSRRR